ncbi:MAG: leucine-rich repeat domain-containing protein [Bacteroides sp.]|nr:leucine-rich repeat domain-containing protein [Bacteroides sp.]
MARLISIFISLFFLLGNCVIAQTARVNKAVYVSKAGTLIDNITLEEAQTVTHLTVTGTINAIDFKNLRNDFDKLRYLDLSNVSIQSYIGKRGTAPNEKFSNYGSNAIPAYAFSFSVEDDIVGKSTLREVILPDKVKNIEENAFMGCNNLHVCKIIRPTAPNIAEGGLDPNVTAIFIPEGFKYAYDRKLQWRDFVIIEGAPVRVSVRVNTPGTLSQEIEKN